MAYSYEEFPEDLPHLYSLKKRKSNSLGEGTSRTPQPPSKIAKKSIFTKIILKDIMRSREAANSRTPRSFVVITSQISPSSKFALAKTPFLFVVSNPSSSQPSSTLSQTTSHIPFRTITTLILKITIHIYHHYHTHYICNTPYTKSNYN